MEFLYSDTIPDEMIHQNQIAFDLISISEVYFMKPLKHVCEKVIELSIKKSYIKSIFRSLLKTELSLMTSLVFTNIPKYTVPLF